MACPYQFFHIVSKTGGIQFFDIGSVYHFMDAFPLLLCQFSVFTENSCGLLERNADGFDKIRLCDLKGVHDRDFYNECCSQDDEMQRQRGCKTAAEKVEQKRQGKQEGIPAIGAEQAHHNT